MKSIPAEQIVGGLSDDLQDLLVREAFVRSRRAGCAAGLAHRQAQSAGQKEAKPSFFRGKEAKAEFEAAGAKLREEVAAYERAIARCDTVLQKCDRILATELERYFEAQSEEFRNVSAALKLGAEWEQAVSFYQNCLKQFIMKLGIARNQMSSGYNRAANAFAPGAIEAFTGAEVAAKTLEAEALIPNRLARRSRELLGLEPAAPVPESSPALPYMPNHNATKLGPAFKTSTLEAAHTRLSALIDECEKANRDDIPRMVEQAAAARATREAGQKRWVGQAFDEIRAMADGSVDPAQMDAVCAAMEARFVDLTG